MRRPAEPLAGTAKEADTQWSISNLLLIARLWRSGTGQVLLQQPDCVVGLIGDVQIPVGVGRKAVWITDLCAGCRAAVAGIAGEVPGYGGNDPVGGYSADVTGFADVQVAAVVDGKSRWKVHL